MHGSNSGQAKGTKESPQITFEQMEYAKRVEEAENNERLRQHYLKAELPKTSPINVPESAVVKEEQKQGYKQVKYSWEKDGYRYLSRWHSRTPNAPENQGDSWVVERKTPGIGYGPNARNAKTEILVGKTSGGKNIWIDKKIWDAAIYARKHGICTKEQEEILKHGHWEA